MRIDTVLFDMGGTIEHVSYDMKTRLEAAKQMVKCLEEGSIDIKLSPEDFLPIMLKGMAEYKEWSEKTFIESHPTEIWHKWVLKDFDLSVDQVGKISEQLAFLWETVGMERDIRKEAVQTLEELKKRGYKLGVISNTPSHTQVYYSLNKYKIRDFFEYVSLSSIEGMRKPDPRIFKKALEEMKSSPEKAVYIGDTITKDVIGSKAAGFAIAIQIRSFSTDRNDANIDKNVHKPDYLIENLIEIVDILDKENR